MFHLVMYPIVKVLSNRCAQLEVYPLSCHILLLIIIIIIITTHYYYSLLLLIIITTLLWSLSIDKFDNIMSHFHL